jgi:hypothetical protein
MDDEALEDQFERELEEWRLGDQALWSKYLARAWREVSGTHSGETFPTWIRAGQEPRWRYKAHALFTAYLHLLRFRLGWTKPGLGLVRWHGQGRPPLDPVLELMGRLQGDGLDWFICWAANRDGVDVPADLSYGDSATGDELHISMHCFAPGIVPGWYPNGVESWPPSFRMVPGALISDDYSGWWNVLQLATDDLFAPDVDVVVNPIGWLGRYQRSPRSGVAHATTEEVHLLGFDLESLEHFRALLDEVRSMHRDFRPRSPSVDDSVSASTSVGRIEQNEDTSQALRDWVSTVQLGARANGTRGRGRWKLDVQRTSAPQGWSHWWPLEVEDADEGSRLRVFHDGSGEVCRVVLEGAGPFDDAAEKYGLDATVFGSRTLWPGGGPRAWVWTFSEEYPFPFVQRRYSDRP